jgi:hypothetical protein
MGATNFHKRTWACWRWRSFETILRRPKWVLSSQVGRINVDEKAKKGSIWSDRMQQFLDHRVGCRAPTCRSCACAYGNQQLELLPTRAHACGYRLWQCGVPWHPEVARSGADVPPRFTVSIDFSFFSSTYVQSTNPSEALSWPWLCRESMRKNMWKRQHVYRKGIVGWYVVRQCTYVSSIFCKIMGGPWPG